MYVSRIYCCCSSNFSRDFFQKAHGVLDHSLYFPNSSFHPISCLTHFAPSGTFPHFISLCSFFSALKEVLPWLLTLSLVSLLMKNSYLKIQSLDAHMRTNTRYLSFSVRVSSFIIDRERNEHSWTYEHWEGLSEQDFSSTGISTNNWQIGSHKQKVLTQQRTSSFKWKSRLQSSKNLYQVHT